MSDVPPSATDLGDHPPRIRTAVPGPKSAVLVEALARAECPALTMRRARRSERSGASHDPIAYREARGANVVDADGNIYVDLVSGFGAASIGHGHPRVVEAVTAQSHRLIHALGDVYPADVKVELLSRLAALAPLPDAKVILGLSGSDAIEAALKTAMLHTGRPGVLAFHGGYHGLSHGPLAVSGYEPSFREPFAAQLNPNVVFSAFPARGRHAAELAIDAVRDAARGHAIGAIVVEPILGRGGVVVPPEGFLTGLRSLANELDALLVIDEILTGLGRTGSVFRVAHEDVTPDLLCVGKALGGGLPVSACIGRGDVMAAWGTPDHEAIHTGTFFGQPLSCAAALATLDVLEQEQLAARAASLGKDFVESLRALERRHDAITEVRGEGLLVAIELGRSDQALRLVRALLERGYITLPAGRGATALELAPPLTIATRLLDGFLDVLDQAIADVSD